MKRGNKMGNKFFVLNKKGEGVLGMGFGVIFSIILIVFILLVGFIAINAFLKTQKCTQLGIFMDDFQSEINKAWNSQKSSFEFKGRLPANLDYVCFANLSNDITAKGDFLDIGMEIGVYEGNDANMFFYPIENACNMPYKKIKNLDINKITELKNPYCIPIEDGNINIQVEKSFSDRLVVIK